jgi:membrane protease YdiL (CAAX protease family)
MSHAPRWPAWAIPVVLVGLIATGLLTTLLAAVLGAALGSDEMTPALVLLAALLNLAVTWLVLRLVARRGGIDLEPAHLGLRRVPPRIALVVLAFGLAAAILVAALSGLAGDPLQDAGHPEELGDEISVIVLDLGTAVSVLARAVIAAIAVEIVLRGFALPALSGAIGRNFAIGVVAVLSSLTGTVELAPAAVVLGVVLCVMYLESGSIVPGIGLNAAVQAFVLGVTLDWSVAESAGLALAAGAAAIALVAGPIRSWDPGPARS